VNGSGAADRVASARSLNSSADAVAVYAQWAATYDDDVFGTLGFTGSERIADLLAAQLSDRRQPILDIGCGTGAVGSHLREHGFDHIDGVDISPEMIAVAMTKDVYRHLSVSDLTACAVLPARSYAGSVSAGTFTTGHVGVGALGDLVAAHRPGAIVAWVIAAALWPAFEPELGSLGVDTLSAELEPVRRGGEAESVMFVGTINETDQGSDPRRR